MKNKLVILLSIVILSFMVIQQASAFCIIQGYTKDANGKFVGSEIDAYCEKLNVNKTISENAGLLWAFAWGDLVETCDDACGNVWVLAKNGSSFGYPSYFPLNSSNNNELATRDIVWTNVTLDKAIIEEPVKRSGHSSSGPSSKNTTELVIKFIEEKKNETVNLTNMTNNTQFGNQVEETKIHKLTIWEIIWNWIKDIFT